MPVAQPNLMSLRGGLLAAVLILVALPLSAGAEEVLLTTQEPLAIDDGVILMIEDVDAQQEVVWISLYQEAENLGSAVLNLGEHFQYRDLDMAVRKIYAGVSEDLVALEINSPLPESELS